MFEVVILTLALMLFVQSLVSLYLMLYTWEHPERLEASSGPGEFREPELSFSVLLPARHEERVIYETIENVWAANYPHELLEVVVICHDDDRETIAEAQRAIRDLGSNRIWVETFSGSQISKPHGLNVGLYSTANEIVTVFDAEDDVDADLFNVVNTIMLNEDRGIVQAGVQLMNFDDHWFSVHNCLEYYFWFKSRLHFHADVGMIPLGGNTVFFQRDLLERVSGWDERCLTEDADIGLKLSALGEPIRVVYDATHVTREETPNSVGAFIRQRTRWHQGFLQVLKNTAWRRLPSFKQRLLALYTLSYPLFQAILALVFPLMLVSIFLLDVHMLVAIVSFLPLYALGFQFLASVVAVYQFAREYGLRVPRLMPLKMAITFIPYQALLAVSALRAVYREGRSRGDWEKTAHTGAHRQPRMPAQQVADLAVEHGSARLPRPTAFEDAANTGRGRTQRASGRFLGYFSIALIAVVVIAGALARGVGPGDQGTQTPSSSSQDAPSTATPAAMAVGEPDKPTTTPSNQKAGVLTPGSNAAATNDGEVEEEADDRSRVAARPEPAAAFAAFWKVNGGRAMFGEPISGPIPQATGGGDPGRVVQYFGGHRLEHHPELAGTPHEVLLGRLGYERAGDLGLLSSEAFQPLPGVATTGENCMYFVETGHQACAAFRDLWAGQGLEFGDDGVSYRESLALHGMPISEAFVDPHSGALVQYFERERFELPAGATDVEMVTTARLGSELFADYAASGAPDDSESPERGQHRPVPANVRRQRRSTRIRRWNVQDSK